MVIVIVMIITVFVLTVLKITEDKNQGHTEDTENTKDTMNEDCDSGWFLISKLNLHISGDNGGRSLEGDSLGVFLLHRSKRLPSGKLGNFLVSRSSFFTKELETYIDLMV